jgi:transcription termination factor NusB
MKPSTDVVPNRECVICVLKTMLLGRAPFDPEVDAEVAREYQRQQEEKRKVRPDHAREIEDVRTRVADLESSLTRIEENATASNKRMEDMMRQILRGQRMKEAIVSEDVTEPASSTKVVQTSTLTSAAMELGTDLTLNLPQILMPTRTPTVTHSALRPLDVTFTEVTRKDHEVSIAEDLPEGHEGEDVYSLDVHDGVQPVKDGVEVPIEENRTDPEEVETLSRSLSGPQVHTTPLKLFGNS